MKSTKAAAVLVPNFLFRCSWGLLTLGLLKFLDRNLCLNLGSLFGVVIGDFKGSILYPWNTQDLLEVLCGCCKVFK